jgi:hypothetical protein
MGLMMRYFSSMTNFWPDTVKTCVGIAAQALMTQPQQHTAKVVTNMVRDGRHLKRCRSAQRPLARLNLTKRVNFADSDTTGVRTQRHSPAA